MSKAFILFASAALAAMPAQALAHGGHIGELAGHSHWIGLAALGLAAGILALLPKGKRKEDAPEDAAEAEGEQKDTAGAQA